MSSVGFNLCKKLDSLFGGNDEPKGGAFNKASKS